MRPSEDELRKGALAWSTSSSSFPQDIKIGFRVVPGLEGVDVSELVALFLHVLWSGLPFLVEG